MKQLWLKIPLKVRIVALYLVGLTGITLNFLIFSAVGAIPLLVGAISLLTGFFTILSEGEGQIVTLNDCSIKRKLFIIPMIVSGIAGICCFNYFWNIFITIAAIVGVGGLYSLVIGEILLGYNPYKVYSGFYAWFAAGTFAFIGFGLIVLVLIQINR
jgi:hypothetical protein